MGSFSLEDAPEALNVYYVHAVAGPDLDDDGFPELDNACTFVATTATPVLFYNPIQAGTSTDKNAVSFRLSVSLLGGGSDEIDHLGYTGEIQFYYLDGLTSVYVDTVYFTGHLSDVFETEPIDFVVTAMFYTIIITDADGCQKVINGEVIDTVPIELLNFEGEARPEGNFLQWTTATETNNHSFTLYHSTQGDEFIPISTMQGAGNSILARQYDFLHRDPNPGINYYRLEQSDFDGISRIVGTIRVLRGENGFAIVQVAPIPARDVAELLFTTAGVQTVEMALYDISGRLLNTYTLAATDGLNSHHLNVSAYPSGVYMIRLTDGRGDAHG